MKRTLIAAVTAALFATTLAGVAVADTSDAAPARVEVRGTADTPDIGQVIRRCRRLFGEHEVKEGLKERCLELWKRWCNAHPDARYCRRPDARRHDCLVADRVVDRRCRPHRPHDQPTDRPIDRPIDRPVDRPNARPADRPNDGVRDLTTDRIRLQATENDVHLRLRGADS
jgi:hypothetical protein